MTTQVHETELEAAESFSEAVNGAMNGCWLGLFVTVDEEGKMHLYRTSYGFDPGRFLEVVALVAKNLVGTQAPREEPAVMPLSQFQELQRKIQERSARAKQIDEAYSIDKDYTQGDS